MNLTTEQIAMICHQANKSLCDITGDVASDWLVAPQEQKDSAIYGVKWRLENPDADSQTQHEVWMNHKLRDGWVYGKEKNSELKTHPCLVPYNQLPNLQRAKDYLFVSIVNSLKEFVNV